MIQLEIQATVVLSATTKPELYLIQLRPSRNTFSLTVQHLRSPQPLFCRIAKLRNRGI